MITEIAIGVISLIPAAIISQKLFDYLNDRLYKKGYYSLTWFEYQKKEKSIRQFCTVVFFFLWILFFSFVYALIIF